MSVNVAGSVPRADSIRRRNNVVVAGTSGGAPVVLAHGFGCDQTMWRHVASELGGERPVVLFDHVGTGGSDVMAYRPSRYSSLIGYARDLLEILQDVALGPVHFVGHSVSAMVGVVAATARPDLFRSLLLVGGSPRYLDDVGYKGGFAHTDLNGLFGAMERNYSVWAHDLAPTVMGNPDRPELTAELEASLQGMQRRIATDFARAIFYSDHRAELAQLDLPVLVVQTPEDPMVPVEVGEYLHRSIRGSQYRLLRATGHFPHLSAPAETTRVIRSFVRSVEDGGR